MTYKQKIILQKIYLDFLLEDTASARYTYKPLISSVPLSIKWPNQTGYALFHVTPHFAFSQKCARKI